MTKEKMEIEDEALFIKLYEIFGYKGTVLVDYKGYKVGYSADMYLPDNADGSTTYNAVLGGNPIEAISSYGKTKEQIVRSISNAIIKYTDELEKRASKVKLRESIENDAVFSIALGDKKTTYISSAEVYEEDENGVEKVDAVNSTLTIYNDKVGDIVIRANSRDGLVVEMPNESPSFNQNNFNTGTVDALINLGKQLEYRRDREANLESIRTKYLEDAEAKVNTVMEEIENNTPEAIAKALEELNK